MILTTDTLCTAPVFGLHS